MKKAKTKKSSVKKAYTTCSGKRSPLDYGEMYTSKTLKEAYKELRSYSEGDTISIYEVTLKKIKSGKLEVVLK